METPSNKPAFVSIILGKQVILSASFGYIFSISYKFLPIILFEEILYVIIRLYGQIIPTYQMIVV